MICIDPAQRSGLKVFRCCLYRYLKENRLRYSDQRERVLKTLYMQRHPATIDRLVRILNEQEMKASYPTVARHINFFNKLGWLKVIGKVHREYLLVQSPPNNMEDMDEDIDNDSF